MWFGLPRTNPVICLQASTWHLLHGQRGFAQCGLRSPDPQAAQAGGRTGWSGGGTGAATGLSSRTQAAFPALAGCASHCVHV